jgi:hypothetical protein
MLAGLELRDACFLAVLGSFFRGEGWGSHCGGAIVLIAHTPLYIFLAFPSGPGGEFGGDDETVSAVALGPSGLPLGFWIC